MASQEDELRKHYEASTILRCTVGSEALGLKIDNGKDDFDEMGIVVESMREAIGLVSNFEQYIYRSAAVREQKHDAPSMAGDLDLTLYSLRKWARLALNGNPNVLLMLYVKPIVADFAGRELQSMASDFASQRAARAFLGYLQNQKQRLLGERGQMDVNRLELTQKYGFDTKFAMHMLRLGLQGIEYMETGVITLPIQEPHRETLRDVRVGKMTLQEVLTWTGELERRLKDLIDASPLPPQPNVKKVEDFVLSVYHETWHREGPFR